MRLISVRAGLTSRGAMRAGLRSVAPTSRGEDARAARRRGTWAGLMREVGLGLVMAGVVLLLFVAYDLFGTSFSEQSSQKSLAQQFGAAVSRSASSAAPAVGGTGGGPGQGQTGSTSTAHHLLSLAHRQHGRRAPSSALGPRLASGARTRAAEVALPLPPPGGALDHLVIPAIGVDRYVVQGVTEQDLQMGPGHYPGTALPGQLGNVGIAGHRTTFGAPFFRLNELRKGDLVYLIDTTGTTWAYSVQRMWVVPTDDVAVLAPTHGAELTLTTCNPRFWATNRLIVRAGLVGRLAPGTKLESLEAELPASLAALRRARAQAADAAIVGGNREVPAVRLLPAKPLPASPAAVPASNTSTGIAGVKPSTLKPSTPRMAERAGADDSVVGPASLSGSGAGAGAWAAAFGWGALAVGLWALVRVLAARQRRYAKAGLIIAGALVCLVPLWFAFGAAVDLLPANF
jgi:sortase A